MAPQSNQTRYYLGFNLVPGIGPARLGRLIEYCGSLEAAWHADDFALAAAGIDGRSSAALIAARGRLDLDAELTKLTRAGITALGLEDPAYPALLRQIPGAPPLIYVRDALIPADERAVAIVGTRNPSTYGREVAIRLAGELAAAGITIVSGLALGIDALAHRAALDAGGRTLAVLGSGVDRPYPLQNRRLADRIRTAGALISDFPLGTAPVAANFPPRNRIISGLALATVVVEAGERSGALITVEFALEQGRDVLAVPGSILAAQNVGTNRLIRNGAQPVLGVQDILAALNIDQVVAQQSARNELPVEPAEALVLEQINAEPRHSDEIGRAIGLSAAETSAALVTLELKGFIRQSTPFYYVRRG
ncbi:MAG: DNA-protecting protein DprA [Oscillochloris sp.]|nr:DNA-protecting protein DprA [Oscillochloris sp.]